MLREKEKVNEGAEQLLMYRRYRPFLPFLSELPQCSSVVDVLG